MAVRIIVDSGVDFPGEVDPRVTVIPLSITFGATTYADGVDITNDRFYEMSSSRPLRTSVRPGTRPW